MNYLEHPLKRCPFCGSAAKRTGGSLGGVVIKICRCSNGECIAAFKSVDYDVWNTRASEEVTNSTTKAEMQWYKAEEQG